MLNIVLTKAMFQIEELKTERDSIKARCLAAEAQNAADAYLIGECVRGAEITDARGRELEAEVDVLKVCALAAEVALEGLVSAYRYFRDTTDDEYAHERIAKLLDELPDLTAARELVRKAGERDSVAEFLTIRGVDIEGDELRNVVMWELDGARYALERERGFLADAKANNAAIALLVTELRGALRYARGQFDSHAGGDLAESVCADALALTLPEAAKRAAAERAFCDAALSFADAKADIEDQANDYKRTLAALQAARVKS